MALTWKDLIKQAVSAGGTGALTLGAAASGYAAFAAGDDGKLFSYSIVDGTAWETGLGTYANTGTAFTRTSRTASSTGSALNVTTNAYVMVDLNSTTASTAYIGGVGVTPGGRLTLETGVPVSTTDQTAKTTIYYTPYVSNVITLWDGNAWLSVEFAETSLALGTITSGKNYDVFGYLSSGALAIEMLVWTSDTARATAVTIQDGRYCKSGDKTRLLLGTFRTTATTTTEDSEAKRFVGNVYNQVYRRAYRADTTSHAYNSATYRVWNNDAANIVQWVHPLAHSVQGSIRAQMNSSGSGNSISVALEVDGTTGTFDSQIQVFHQVTTLLLAGATQVVTFAAGYHFFGIMEGSNTTATNTFGSVKASSGVTQ